MSYNIILMDINDIQRENYINAGWQKPFNNRAESKYLCLGRSICIQTHISLEMPLLTQVFVIITFFATNMAYIINNVANMQTTRHYVANALDYINIEPLTEPQTSQHVQCNQYSSIQIHVECGTIPLRFFYFKDVNPQKNVYAKYPHIGLISHI